MEGQTSSKEIPAKKRWREYCFVPKCTNTRVSTPEKTFVNVPDNPVLRRKWLIAARRDMMTMPLSVSTHLRCCEDHFNLAEDAENYMRWKIMGGPLRIRNGVLPHIFHCQERPTLQPLRQRTAVQKRERMNILKDCLQTGNSLESVECANLHPTDPADEGEGTDESSCQPPNEKPLYRVHRGIQARSPFRSKVTQTGEVCKSSIATSPIKVSMRSTHTSPIKKEFLLLSSSCSSEEDYSDSSFRGYSSDSSFSDDEGTKRRGQESYNIMLYYIERDPKLYLGISAKSYKILALLCEHVKTSQRNIMLCLKKIKLNDQIKILGNEFGLHYATVSRVLRDKMPVIAMYMQDLIFWPSEESRLRTLPMAFIANFSNVTCIIDCLEIAIEKPSNALHQAQSWSQYKKANTIKYLISCLPNGYINFISDGYLGRASDEAITMDCGFLDKIPPGSTVMADRGFKNLESVLVKRSCRLVRPPSLSTGQIMTQSDARMTKKIASLRIHVERVIGRIRDFSILKPSMVMDHSLVGMSDYMIVIACALVNLEKQIVRA